MLEYSVKPLRHDISSAEFMGLAAKLVQLPDMNSARFDGVDGMCVKTGDIGGIRTQVYTQPDGIGYIAFAIPLEDAVTQRITTLPYQQGKHVFDEHAKELKPLNFQMFKEAAEKYEKEYCSTDNFCLVLKVGSNGKIETYVAHKNNPFHAKSEEIRTAIDMQKARETAFALLKTVVGNPKSV